MNKCAHQNVFLENLKPIALSQVGNVNIALPNNNGNEVITTLHEKHIHTVGGCFQI